MLSPGKGVRIFVGLTPVDMRGSFDALAGHARRLGLEPTDGHLYLFFNRRRRLCKMLWFDGSGWCLFSKRLERGTFELPAVPDDGGDGTPQVTIDKATLSSLLEGIDLRAKRRRWYRRS
ncbi:MAG: IS66 family insertion sequence element accessory protein TnpB [Thermoanaerobaculia bacterium]|nr:IS66 family insertion sequence element accessory protein TnpB [Thermoanaerobaculia bacterium]